jgi:hypothetical protein
MESRERVSWLVSWVWLPLAVLSFPTAVRAEAPTYSIYELQVSDAAHDWQSAHFGEIVKCVGGVVTHKFKQRFALQDPTAGSEWAAIEVRGYPVYPSGIEVGDQVDFDSVYVDEFRGATVLQYYSASGHVVNSSGNPLPEPLSLSLWDIRYPAHPEDCERYAAMLVSVAEEITIGALDLGAHLDNYELLGAWGDSAWASDYANTDIDTTYHVESGECYQELVGVLQRYTYEPDWDYYQLLPRGNDDYTLCGTDVAWEPEGREGAIWLAAPCPSPFAAQAVIRFGIPGESADVRVGVFDATGRRLRAWSTRSQGGGLQQVIWDGNDRDGHPVAAGVYFIRLSAGRESVSRRIVCIR